MNGMKSNSNKLNMNVLKFEREFEEEMEMNRRESTVSEVQLSDVESD